MKRIIILLFCCAAWQAKAQFIEPNLLNYATVKELTIVDTAGKTYSGKTSYIKQKKGLPTEIAIKVNDEKMEFTPEQIRYVYAKATEYSRLSKLGGSIQRMSKQKVGNKKDTLVYESLKNEDGDFVLLQLINPGYDTKIKVYANPAAGKTMSWTGIDGGMDRSYYVSKNGEAVRKIVKKDMREEFAKLFGDCAAMEGKTGNWDDFDKYIETYNECK